MSGENMTAFDSWWTGRYGPDAAYGLDRASVAWDAATERCRAKIAELEKALGEWKAEEYRAQAVAQSERAQEAIDRADAALASAEDEPCGQP